MKIHTVFVTYNRLELTKRAIESYLETVSVPFRLMVVDNRSTDNTIQYLNEALEDHLWVVLNDNYYPGYACNYGWRHLEKDTTHLHRADNDFIFLSGWCEEVEHQFDTRPNLGQLGLRTDEEELWNGNNVGGNCVIRRKLWDKGLRYDERPWPEIDPPGYTEDSYFSPAVAEMGWEWGRVEKPCIAPISIEDFSDPYYQATWAARRLRPPV